MKRIHTGLRCLLLLCVAFLIALNCFHTRFVRGAGKPWNENISLIVIDAVKRVIGDIFQRRSLFQLRERRKQLMQSYASIRPTRYAMSFNG